MPNSCTICSHPQRVAIDREIVKGVAIMKIARNFAVDYHCLYRHAHKDLSRQLSQAMEKKSTTENYNLLERIDQIVVRAEEIFIRNQRAGKDLIALKALSEQRSTFELLAKISYSLHQAKQAELELSRQQSGEGNVEQMHQFQQDLSILTLDELKVMQLLQQKLQTQDSSINVLASIEPDICPDLSTAHTYTPFEEQEPNSAEESVRAEEQGTALRSKAIVRPIVSREIPSSDHESNSFVKLPRR